MKAGTIVKKRNTADQGHRAQALIAPEATTLISGCL